MHRTLRMHSIKVRSPYFTLPLSLAARGDYATIVVVAMRDLSKDLTASSLRVISMFKEIQTLHTFPSARFIPWFSPVSFVGLERIIIHSPCFMLPVLLRYVWRPNQGEDRLHGNDSHAYEKIRREFTCQRVRVQPREEGCRTMD